MPSTISVLCEYDLMIHNYFGRKNAGTATINLSPRNDDARTAVKWGTGEYPVAIEIETTVQIYLAPDVRIS
jgi:hypothetical protein